MLRFTDAAGRHLKMGSKPAPWGLSGFRWGAARREPGCPGCRRPVSSYWFEAGRLEAITRPCCRRGESADVRRPLPPTFIGPRGVTGGGKHERGLNDRVD